jgi:hypothetical protein
MDLLKITALDNRAVLHIKVLIQHNQQVMQNLSKMNIFF